MKNRDYLHRYFTPIQNKKNMEIKLKINKNRGNKNWHNPPFKTSHGKFSFQGLYLLYSFGSTSPLATRNALIASASSSSSPG